MEEFKDLYNKEIQRLFIIVKPPFDEEELTDLNMSIGFVFENNPEMMVISTDEEIWTPCVSFEEIPEFTLPWMIFFNTLNENFLKSVEQGVLNADYYEVTNVADFQEIVGHRIQSFELIRLQNNTIPFGVRMDFENDYILSTPIYDGNTIETSKFNRIDNISFFEKIEPLEYQKFIV